MFEHLKDHDLSYRQHQRLAFLVAREAIKVCIMAFLHGLWPRFFVHGMTASSTLNTIMPKYEALEAELKSGVPRGSNK